MKISTRKLIDSAVERARKKHPKFSSNDYHAACILTEEVGEFCQAINDGPKRRFDAMQEARDIIAVCVRFLEGE